MGGEGWHQTVPDRVLLTLLGGVLAMLAYVAFPAWETPRMLDRLADWLAASGRYAAAVVRGYAEPGELPATDVRRTLLADRTAHATWNEALDRVPLCHQGDPGPQQQPCGDRGDGAQRDEGVEGAVVDLRQLATARVGRAAFHRDVAVLGDEE